MQRICIFQFSGTGMTAYVVEELQSELAKLQVCCEIFNIENIHPLDISVEDFDAIGIAYPVHSFNAPKIVANFVKRLPQAESLNAFIIGTVGEYIFLNLAASRMLIKILSRKGYHVYFEKQFEMPSNFLIKDSENAVREKLKNIRADMPNAAHDIALGIPQSIKSGWIAGIIAVIGRVEWYGTKWMHMFLTTDKNCSRCGICAANCPNGNISVAEKRIRFRWKCGLCMRCFYICPQQSVRIRFPFRAFCLGKWYEMDELSLAKLRNREE